LPGWVLEPVKGASILRNLLRSRSVVSGEAMADLIDLGRTEGLELAGYRCGAALIAGLESALPLDEGQREIRQSALGGSALWLRSEPGEDAGQAASLADLIAREISA
jgi:hypothetical protein